MHCWPCVLFGAALAAPGAIAHHSISRSYDENHRVTISGTLAEFRLVQPHPFMMLEVSSGEAAPALWRLEMDNYSELVEIGLTPETFRPGDRVVATGAQSRDDKPQLYLRRLDRPADGLRYEQIGYRPRLGTMSDAAANRSGACSDAGNAPESSGHGPCEPIQARERSARIAPRTETLR